MISHASRVMTRLLLTVWPILLLLALLSLACAPPRRLAPTPPTVEAPPPAPLQFEFVTKWGTEGDGPGQFRDPSGIAVDGQGNIYVFDSGNYRVQKFSPDGEFLLQFGSRGSGNGQFGSDQRSPLNPAPHTGIAVDGEGNVYVFDSGNCRMQRFTTDGEFLAKWGRGGGGRGQFAGYWPGVPCGSGFGVAVDGSGNVYVTDAGNHRVQKFDPDGNFLLKWGPALFYPGAVTVNRSDTVYMLDMVAHTTSYRFNTDGQFVEKLLLKETYGIYSSAGIAVDTLGNIYVANGRNGIEVFSTSGQSLAFLGKGGLRTGGGDGEFDGPAALALDKSGNVYVADSKNNRVQKFRPVPSAQSQH